MLDDPGFYKNQTGEVTFAPDWPDISWEAVVKPADIPGAAGLLNQLTLTVSWDAERSKLALVQYVAK